MQCGSGVSLRAGSATACSTSKCCATTPASTSSGWSSSTRSTSSSTTTARCAQCSSRPSPPPSDQLILLSRVQRNLLYARLNSISSTGHFTRHCCPLSVRKSPEFAFHEMLCCTLYSSNARGALLQLSRDFSNRAAAAAVLCCCKT